MRIGPYDFEKLRVEERSLVFAGADHVALPYETYRPCPNGGELLGKPSESGPP